MLAAVLPNPKGWDPTKPARTLRRRQKRILQREQHANFPEQLLRLSHVTSFASRGFDVVF